MTKLTFYHQVRADGGKRTGIDWDDIDLLQIYEDGAEEVDPVLLWYVDIQCHGEDLPTDPQGARDWFLRNEAFFREQLRVASDELTVGFDPDYVPFRFEMPNAPDGARGEIVVSATRRLAGREVAENVRRVANDWSRLLGRLARLSPA